MAKNRKTTNRNRNTPPKQEPNFLASASIKYPVDTNILNEDLFYEFTKDSSNSDGGLLVNDKWVRFFDAESSFLKGMMALVTNSTTLRNILGKKASLTLGDGFVPVASESVPYLQTLRNLFRIKSSDDKAIEAVNDLIGCVNLNNESLEEVIEKVAFDWWAFGNAIVELVKTTKDGNPIVYIYHVPIEQVGIHVANKNNIVESIGITSNWDVDGNNPNEIREVSMYPNFKSNRSAIHIKNYSPGFFYWGLPENIASRFWAEIEYRIPKYNIAKFKNSFRPSAIIQAYGSFTPKEANALVESFKSLYTGTDNNDDLLVQVMRKKEDKADITVLEDKTEGNYIELQRIATQAIVTANQWTMSLSGLATSGKLGTNQQIRDELEFVTNTSIKQARRKIIQAIINPFIKENQKVNPATKGIMLHIANMNPISLASLLEPKTVLSRDEQREVFGYEAEGEKGAANTDETRQNEQQ